MTPFILNLLLFSILVVLGQLFKKSTVPIALILVIFGMLLSFIPIFPTVSINYKWVLDIFLPLLIYQISSFSSWREMKKYARSIALLSIGHVLFITVLVAVVAHALIPQMSWPLAFVLGAILSPPDDVAIVAIAEKVRIPRGIFIILEGEGLFNDAAALTLFRFALAAAITNQFSLFHAFSAFVAVIIGETLYGLLLGHLVGILRTRISSTPLHIIASCLTPFLAYIPVVEAGGSGIIATAVVGFIIGNHYSLKFSPEYRLTAFVMWPTMGFAIQGLIFLWVGLDLRSILMRISSIPLESLGLYLFSFVTVVIVGRFIWVYGFVAFLPRFILSFMNKKGSYLSWKYPFIISWAGMRGGISLSAALAIPPLTLTAYGVDIRDLLVFIVFSIIFVTLVLQGLSLPFVLRKLGFDHLGQSEKHSEQITELKAKIRMINAALKWLHKHKKEVRYDKKMSAEVAMHVYEYQMLKSQLLVKISDAKDTSMYVEKSQERKKLSLLQEVIEVEKEELSSLWLEDKINLKTRNKLMATLDHHIQRHMIG